MPSSVISWMRYIPSSRSLLIAFRSGALVYRYFDVPAEEWAAFRAAPSKGTYLNTVFKEGGYGFERVEADLARPGPAGDAYLVWGQPPGSEASRSAQPSARVLMFPRSSK